MWGPLLSGATRFGLRLYGFRRSRITVRGWSVAVYRGGRRGGQPWILLPGLGATGATFAPLLGAIRAERELWIVEPSAHGGTRGPSPAWSVASGTELLAELLRRGDLPAPATLCGISLGGWFAIRLALIQRSSVSRLLLFCPGGYRNQDWERILRMVQVRSFRSGREIWQALFARPPWWLPGGQFWLSLLYRSAVVRSALAGIRQEDAFANEELTQLDVPVGLIWGTEDRLFSIEVARQMGQALRQGRLWEIPGAAHSLLWEQSAAVLQAVRDFEQTFPLNRPLTSKSAGVELDSRSCPLPNT